MTGSNRRLAEQGRILFQWASLGLLVGIACGVGSGVFLYLLERVTHFRMAHEQIVYTLPLAGVAIGWAYDRWGKSIKGGNNLVIDTFHEESAQLPLRMGPMVLLGTVLTHLFGGSAGREGTAVQMGASFADAIAHKFKVSKETRRQLLAAGMAGGFGSVFGTPIAGAFFGLEVSCVGRVEYDALLPALIASVVGDWVTRRVIVHATYTDPSALPLSPLLLGKWLLVGAAVAAATVAFVELTHAIKKRLERRAPALALRMFLGGVAVVGMWKLVGTSDYLGLGVPTIQRAFLDTGLPWDSFALKLLFTAVTLGAGFLGGEVTPLFFVGAALGNVLGRLLGIPLPMAAGVCMAALFGAAANTPIALSLMAVELLGGHVFPHVVVVSVVAYLLTGHRGIYPAQRIARLKHGGPLLARWLPLRAIAAPVELAGTPGAPRDSLETADPPGRVAEK